MKKRNLPFYVVMICFVIKIQVMQAQTAGGVAAGFGINSVIYSNSAFSTGTTKPPAGTVDWFLGTGGRNVIDQTNPSAVQAVLQGVAVNPLYTRRMNGAVHSLADVSGNTYQELIDAVWARDEFGGTGGTDNTGLGIGSKNGQGPEIWSVISGNVLGKNDLIDVGGHMFRDISTNKNDLWFVGLINRAEPNGDAYMDFEFFVKDVALASAPTPHFTSGGDELGHTAFQFDASGNFTHMGDMLYNMSLTGGGVNVGIEVRIWVSYADYTSVTPTAFNWGPNFDGPVNGSPYGYASITPKSAGIMYGFVNGATQKPTAPPWGARTTKSNIWVPDYDEYSVSEMGLNLTSFGLDDYLLAGYNKCYFSWRTFIVKTRSSAAFTAALKDFAGPYTWGKPSVDITASNAILNCSNPVAILTPSPMIADATFGWTTADGHIVGSTTSSSIQVDQPGNYLLTATLSSGCAIQSPPFVVASSISFISGATTAATISCGGNDGTVNLTVSGGTAPFAYSWTKDGNPFAATTEDLSGLAPGTYVATISYGSGCTFASDPAVVAAKAALAITQAITDVLCYGDKNGAISLSVTGKSPFTYLWSNGQTTKDLVNIAAGSYTVTITDGDGCKSTMNYTVQQPLAALAASISKINDTNVDPVIGDGSANLTVTGGTSAYAYSWTGPGTFSSTTEDLTNLNYGGYSVTVTDAHNCTTTASVFIYQPEICDDGIDNDGDGLTDCEDIADCKPAAPPVTGDASPCTGHTVSYSANTLNATVYMWQYPSNAVYVSGAGTATLIVSWNSTVPSQICVQAQSAAGCISNATCISVSPTDVPAAPASILKN